MNWRKNREIIFDFNKGPVPEVNFNSNEKYYKDRINELIELEDYESAALLKKEAIANGVNIDS